MLSSFFKRTIDYNVYSIAKGTMIPMNQIKDSTFSQGVLGPAIGIYPSEYAVFSPFEGEVTMVFPTKHAMGLKRKDGLELLIHIGIETVQLNGKGFQVHVKKGDEVKKGELLVSFDNNLLQENSLDSTIIIVFTDTNKFHYSIHDKKILNVGDVIASAEKK